MKRLFVYNAGSGLASALFDSAHKLFSPCTYPCNLCAPFTAVPGLSDLDS